MKSTKLAVCFFCLLPIESYAQWATPFGRPFNNEDKIEKEINTTLGAMTPYKSDINFIKEDYREMVINGYKKVTFYFKVTGQFLYGYRDVGGACETAGAEIAWFYMSPIDIRDVMQPSMPKSEYKTPSRFENKYWTTYGDKVSTIYKPIKLNGQCNGPEATGYMSRKTAEYSRDRVNELNVAAGLIMDEIHAIFSKHYNTPGVPFDIEIIKSFGDLGKIGYFIPELLSEKIKKELVEIKQESDKKDQKEEL